MTNISSSKSKIAVIVSLVVVSVLAVFLAIGYLIFARFGGNQAVEALTPLSNDVVTLGATQICKNGDGGKGIDNQIPWHSIYFRIPDKPDLTERIKNIAKNNNFPLSVDKKEIETVKSSNSLGVPGRGKYSSNSDYLVSNQEKRTLKVQVVRDGSIPLYCGVKDYGKVVSPSENEAIVNLTLDLASNSQ